MSAGGVVTVIAVGAFVGWIIVSLVQEVRERAECVGEAIVDLQSDASQLRGSLIDAQERTDAALRLAAEDIAAEMLEIQRLGVLAQDALELDGLRHYNPADWETA